jgi:hypothetical protein
MYLVAHDVAPDVGAPTEASDTGDPGTLRRIALPVIPPVR